MTDQSPLPLHDRAQGPSPRLDTVIDGHSVRFWIVVAATITVVVLGFGALWTYVLDRDTQMSATTGMVTDQMADAGAVAFPSVHGFYDGEDILFIHTEASDPQVAGMLAGMMGSSVQVVPELAEIPEAALANVYVFTNGVQPDDARGPFGFQADLFRQCSRKRGLQPTARDQSCDLDRGSEPSHPAVGGGG